MMGSETNSFGFSQELRLLSAKQFSFVFADASRIGNKAFTVLFRKNGQTHPRLGLAIAKKQVKLATGRNLIKRKIRESFRLNQHRLPAVDLVFMVRRDINHMDAKAIDDALAHVWRKTRKLCENY